VYQKRKKSSAYNDIWSLSFNWVSERRRIQKELLLGTYQLQPIETFWTPNGRLTRWSSVDAVVLKAISMKLTEIMLDSG